jgi:hypothetical protein
VDKLFQICIDAATTAELSLRGEIVLLESDEAAAEGEDPIKGQAAREIEELAKINAAPRQTSDQTARPAYSFRFGTKE